MSALRVLCTGFALATLERPIGYLLQSGVKVLHAGTEPALRGLTQAQRQGYSFVPLDGLAGTDIAGLGADAQARDAAVLRAANHLRDLERSFQPHVIHAHGLDIFSEACARANLHPLVASVWGYLEEYTRKDNDALRRQFGALLDTVDAWVAEAPLFVNMCASFARPGALVRELCTGLDETLFTPAEPAASRHTRRAFHLPETAPLVLSPRGWGNKYAHERVLKAFARALPDLPADSRLAFILMGRNRSEAVVDRRIAEVRAMANALGIADRVAWLPALPPAMVPTVLNMADVVVSCADPDTFPATVLEALACEKPVIVPRLPSFEGTVIARHCAHFEPGNTDDLARAVRVAVLNPPPADARAAAREDVVARYGRAPVTRQLLDLYGALATSPSPAS